MWNGRGGGFFLKKRGGKKCERILSECLQAMPMFNKPCRLLEKSEGFQKRRLINIWEGM